MTNTAKQASKQKKKTPPPPKKNQLAAWGIAGPKTISVNSCIQGGCTCLFCYGYLFSQD